MHEAMEIYILATDFINCHGTAIIHDKPATYRCSDSKIL